MRTRTRTHKTHTHACTHAHACAHACTRTHARDGWRRGWGGGGGQNGRGGDAGEGMCKHVESVGERKRADEVESQGVIESDGH